MKRNIIIITFFISLLCLGAVLEEPLRDWTGFRGVSLNQETYDANYPLNMTGDANIVGSIDVNGTVDTRDVSDDGDTLDALVITVTGLQDVTLDDSATDGGMSINASQRIFNRPATNAQTGYMTDTLVTNIESNNTHRSSTGADHTFIDQSVVIGSSPVFDGNNFTGIDANGVDIADAGGIITATEVEGALQENRTAIDLNTTHRSSDGTDHANVVLGDTHRLGDGSDHSDVALNTTHRGSDGKDHSDVVLNNTHRSSDGSDHTFIDQDMTSGSSPTFDGANITGVDAVNVDIADAGGIITATEVEGALQENRTAVDLNTTHRNTTSGNPHTVTLEEVRSALNVLQGNIDFNDNNIVDVNEIGFQGGQVVSWNPNDYTIDVPTGLGPVLQVGQEQYILVYNDTGVQIDNGKAVYDSGVANGLNTIALAQSDYFTNFATRVMMSTMDIPDANVGFCTLNGQVRDVNTADWNIGDLLYIDPDVAGDVTATRPIFPDYPIQIGRVLTAHATTGSIQVGIVHDDEHQTTVNFWNGIFRESIDFTITSNGTVITGMLEPRDGHDDMTMMFSDGFSILDTNPAKTITLTAGTDEIPQTNYIYVPESTEVLTVSTSEWPVTEHIKVCTAVLRSAATTQTDGALRNQNWNDHIQSTTYNQGHLSHIGERIRQENAKWDSGCEGSSVIDAGYVAVQNTAGVVYQLHRQTFPIIDTTAYTIDAVSTGSDTFTISDDGDLSTTFPDGRQIAVYGSTGNDGMWTISSTVWSSPNFTITVVEDITDATADGSIGDDIHVVNDFTTAYLTVNDLSDVTTDASGGALNNTSFSIVVWGVMNRSGQPSHLMANMPSGTYSKNFPEQAVSDSVNYSIYSIPKLLQGVGFLVARFTYVNNAGVWSLYDTEDLRGSIPNTTAGGGAGGVGVTTFLGLLDTPSSYASQALNVPRVNAGETALEFLDITTDWLTQYFRTDGTRDMTGDVNVGGFDIVNVGTVDGVDIATDVAANTTHRTSNGTDHTYLDQDVQTTASPVFAGLTVDTDTLHVDDVNDRVGFGTTIPNQKTDLRDGWSVITAVGVSQPITTGILAGLSVNAHTLIGPFSATNGGTYAVGVTDSDARPMVIQGSFGVTDPTDTTSGIRINANKSDGGTSVVALADAETIFDVVNNGTVRLSVKGNGDTDIVGDLTAGTIQADNGVSGTLVMDDGSTERITLVFTGGVLTSRTVAASTALLIDWTD